MIRLLSGGAAHGIVQVLHSRIEAATGQTIDGDFGPVGGMRDRIVGGEAVDMVILSRRLLEELAESGHVLADSLVDIGDVATGIAVRKADADAACATPEELRATLLAADGLFFPDPVTATAGIHFANVLKSLGIHEVLEGRFRTYPGGIPAMAALGQSTLAAPIGCTQVTEIVRSPGVRLVGLLPPGCDLVTTYTAAIAAHSAKADAVRRVIDILAAPEAAAERRSVGFGG